MRLRALAFESDSMEFTSSEAQATHYFSKLISSFCKLEVKVIKEAQSWDSIKNSSSGIKYMKNNDYYIIQPNL